MSRLSYASRRRKASDLILSGAGTLTFGQRIRVVESRSTRDALTGDWAAIGDDLRKAIGRARREFEAA
jgi:hypothetical protein